PSPPFCPMALPKALFTLASAAAREAARREFLRTPMGRVITGLRNDYRAGLRESSKLESALEDLKRHGLRGALSTLQGGSLNGLVNDLSRLMRSDRGMAIAIRQFLRNMGAAGKIIGAIVDA